MVCIYARCSRCLKELAGWGWPRYCKKCKKERQREGEEVLSGKWLQGRLNKLHKAQEAARKSKIVFGV